MGEELAVIDPAAVSVFLDPEKFEMLQRGSKLLASSTMVPKEYQGNPSNCAIAINIADRLGADVFAITQSMDVIYGRPSWRASFLIGMINASRRFTPLQFKIEKGEVKTVTLTIPYWENNAKKSKKVDHTYQDMGCIAWAKDSSGEVVEGPPVTMDMAIAEGWLNKDGSKWMTMQEVMIRYRAGAFFARLYAPDITLGMHTREEIEDSGEMRNVTPKAEIPDAPVSDKVAPFSKTQLNPEEPPVEEPVSMPSAGNLEASLRRAYIVEIEKNEGEKDGKPWTRYRVTLSFGDESVVATTFSTRLGDLAMSQHEKWVLAHTEKGSRGVKLVDLQVEQEGLI